MSKEPRPSRMNQLKRFDRPDEGAIAVLTSVAKRRNLLGLANTLAKELNDSEELVRRFWARRNAPPPRR